MSQTKRGNEKDFKWTTKATVTPFILTVNLLDPLRTESLGCLQRQAAAVTEAKEEAPIRTEAIPLQLPQLARQDLGQGVKLAK